MDFFYLYDYNFKYGAINNILTINIRYHDQISIFEDKIQEKLKKSNIFECGERGVGCKLIKNLALMGVSTEKEGPLELTDYDKVENSNLNRQFLFNSEKIYQFKSKITCDIIKKMNKSFNCKDFHQKVSKEAENIFDKNFWERKDIIISTVDDDKARVYLNDQCLKFNKMLLNIGTSRIRSKVDIVIPKIPIIYK